MNHRLGPNIDSVGLEDISLDSPVRTGEAISTFYEFFINIFLIRERQT